MSGIKIPPIGTLTDRVQLRRRDNLSESEGGQVAAFTALATVWARIRSLSERQAGEVDARGRNITHSVVMRFRTDLKPGDRILYRGRVLEVAAANDLNGHRAYLSCHCVERAVTG
ncbi:MAG: phage head closure protein [Devosia sp.]